MVQRLPRSFSTNRQTFCYTNRENKKIHKPYSNRPCTFPEPPGAAEFLAVSNPCWRKRHLPVSSWRSSCHKCRFSGRNRRRYPASCPDPVCRPVCRPGRALCGRPTAVGCVVGWREPSRRVCPPECGNGRWVAVPWRLGARLCQP